MLITVGGIGTILAVAFICVFLVWVVFPLLVPASVGESKSVVLAGIVPDAVHLEVDDYKTMVCVVGRDGEVSVHDFATGRLLDRRRIFGDAVPTAWSLARPGEPFAAGFADGSVRAVALRFRARFLDEGEGEALPDELHALEAGQPRPWEGGIVERTSAGQLRHLVLEAEVGDPLEAAGAAVRLLDYSRTPSGFAVAALDAQGGLFLSQYREKLNMLTGKTRVERIATPLPYDPPGNRDEPSQLALSGVGDNAFLVWPDGYLLRFDASSAEGPRLAETTELTRPGKGMSAFGYQPGKTTLLVGGAGGTTRAWFRTRPDQDPGTLDGSVLSLGHELSGPASAVTAFGPSSRSRLLAVGYADGTIRLFYVTSDDLHADVRVRGGAPVERVALSPREDAIVALADGSLHAWELDPGHPEASLRSLFRPIWYEGHQEPEHVWQSSGSTDDFEPKFGLWPLIFGTLKGTLYSMLFGAPLAILAAMYTSEFLHARYRTAVKSTVEIMASLPSVVLGFLAGIVIAPFVQGRLTSILAAFYLVPLFFLLGSQIWQLLPERWTLRLSGIPRLLAMAATVPLAVFVALPLGPALESLLFHDRQEDVASFTRWLNEPDFGSPVAGWFLLLIPIAAIAVTFLARRFTDAPMRRIAAERGRDAAAWASFLRFVCGFAATLGVAYLLAVSLSEAFDPRGSVLGTYVQRNALVVGFVMGFAIVPIIYTLTEDALSGVPMHLREASLGAGATPWQTAVRVIVPSAMSGIFSAVMIGLGRAVGETMIVLMATGNTSVLDWNVFNGFRTLSANIAVELPEAVRDSTHYRTLFLAALVLFVMTFLVNTAAEGVRQRFRRRAYEL